jgi:hypothetical protein
VYLVINTESFVGVLVAQICNLWPHRLETGATEKDANFVTAILE